MLVAVCVGFIVCPREMAKLCKRIARLAALAPLALHPTQANNVPQEPMSQLTPELARKIMLAEGEYNPNDWPENYNSCGQLVGGKYGITPKAYEDYTKTKCPTADAMKAIGEQQAMAFMQWYGKRWRVWEVDDQDFAGLLFNGFYGNPKNAALALQKTLNARGYGLVEDGIMGSKTLAATNVELRRDRLGLYNAYREAWVRYLASLNSAEFAQGWMNRMNTHFPALIGGGAVTAAPASAASVTAEVWKHRFLGVFRSKEDAAYVAVAVLGLAAVAFAIWKFMQNRVTLPL